MDEKGRVGGSGHRRNGEEFLSQQVVGSPSCLKNGLFMLFVCAAIKSYAMRTAQRKKKFFKNGREKFALVDSE